MTSGIEILLSNIRDTLIGIYPMMSMILIILSGIIWGLAQAQPAEQRGKWQNMATGFLVGGIIIAAIGFSYEKIFEIGKTLGPT